MGEYVGQWADQQIKELHFHFRFPKIHDLRPLVMTACAEIMRYQYLEVNIINIQEFIDKLSLNLIIQTNQNIQYDNGLQIEAKFEDGSTFSLIGTVIAGIPKIMEIQERKIEMIPIGQGFILTCVNVPGVIGSVASLLGDWNINITNLSLPQVELGAECFSYIQTNQEISEELEEELKQIENVLDIRKVKFM